MKNPWLKNRVGIVKVTNGHLYVIQVNLPARYLIKNIFNSITSSYTTFRAVPDDNGDLIWNSVDSIEVNGIQRKLLYQPAFSAVLSDYSFTVV